MLYALSILFFVILPRRLWEYQGQGSSPPRTIPYSDGLDAGSFAGRKDKDLQGNQEA